MFEMTVTCVNPRSFEPIEYKVYYYSLFAVDYLIKNHIKKCVDVLSILVVDAQTGEVMRDWER